jgi:type IV pilus assembly protein PilA
MNNQTAGFTLLEMMIVIAIIGILISIALPSYRRYTQRAHFSEIVQALAPYKVGVEECYQVTDSFDTCNAGQDGMPPAMTTDHGLIHQLTVTSGIIRVTPRKIYGISPTDTLILTPELKNDTIMWKKSGGAVKRGLVR